jgi:hypothetical protein
MTRMVLVAVSVLVLLGSQACCCLVTPSLPDIRIPGLPDIDIRIWPFGSRVEVGPMQELDEAIPSEGVEEARVEVRFGVGEISLAAGEPESLFSGHFRTNVAEWVPEVTWEGGLLRIEPREPIRDVAWNADERVVNEWQLWFSPAVPLDMDVEIGAARGELDFTGLALAQLTLEAGASDIEARFDAPNLADMSELAIRVGAADLEVRGIGNASPERVRVEGGAGNLELDLTGAWSDSATVEVTAGAGSVTITIPDDVGAWVDIEGVVSRVQLEGEGGWSRDGEAYVNAAYGDAEVELRIEITIAAGSVRLVSVGE